MRIRLLILFACGLIVGVGACEDPGSQDGDGVLVSDSAGVRVVLHEQPPSAPYARIDTSSGVTIGAELWDVTAAIHLDGGTIVVADGGGTALRFFDSEGRPERVFAEHGNGPGEFMRFAWLGRRPDGGFAAWDRVRRLVNFFTEDGRIESQRSFAGGGRPMTVIGLLGDESGVVEQQTGAEVEGDLARRRLALHVVDAGSDMDAPFLDILGPELYTHEDGVLQAPPHARRPLFGFGGTDRFVYSPSDPFELRWFVEEELRTIVRREVEAIPLDELHSQQPPPFPDLHQSAPPIVEIMMDRRGMAWVRPAVADARPMVDWEVYDMDGHQLGYVRVPTDMEVLDVGRESIVVVERDSLDVERVTVYPLSRGGALD